ncbi:zf-ZPR1-domain-containing protein [Polychaeton citri CBS 116435]|uniref:Zf-ZPR1-domain-containing protein n=1 Tax=Polychaeton citri CBS 116435 TaxID=1314669 RepID=A0A9P4Q212_9PEZI|nr:zf-ZPR1-domain-containing protein [Polychaeton citri CBS 116435]
MADQLNGERLTGSALAKDLFEDMGCQVEGIGANGGNNGDADTEQRVVEEIESLCMNCRADGTTRMLLTRIPFFREIVIMSFSCPECHFHNNEIQAAGSIQERGAKYIVKLDSEQDLQRQVVKGDNCVLRIEDLDLEIPAGRGQFTNIEGILRGIAEDLQSHQDARMQQMPEVGAQVAAVIQKLGDFATGKVLPFTVSADDLTGNSWIEWKPAEVAGKWQKHEYNRTPQQNAVLGLGDDVPQNGETEAPETEIRPEYRSQNMVGGAHDMLPASQNNVDGEEILEDQVYSFPASCPGCTRPCATNMKMVNIPHFKQVVLMSTVCDHCGYRSNEVKTGGEVPEKGRRITLQVDTIEDLSRDVLKSESAALKCPELQLSVEPGTMGGRFTTVEGLLTNIRKDLRGQAFGLEDGDASITTGHGGDSMLTETKRTWEEFFEQLTDAAEGRKKFTVIIEDPLASSYVQSFTAPEPDPKIKFEDYDRTEEEEQDLGLRDIKVEGYEDDAADVVAQS